MEINFLSTIYSNNYKIYILLMSKVKASYGDNEHKDNERAESKKRRTEETESKKREYQENRERAA